MLLPLRWILYQTSAQPVAVRPTGGWEAYLRYRKRQERIGEEEKKRLETIESRTAELEVAKSALEQDKARKDAEKSRDRQRIQVQRELDRRIAYQEAEIANLLAEIESLVILARLEQEAEEQNRIRHKRMMLMALMMDAA